MIRSFRLPFLLVLSASAAPTRGADPTAQRPPFEIVLASTGTGQILPYRMRELDANGNPGPRVVDIRSRAVLDKNLSSNNRVLPVATYSPMAVLPNGAPGNHFLLVRFSSVLDLRSLLSDVPLNHQHVSGLTGSLLVAAYDPVTETTTVVKGVGFVGGKTFLDDPRTPAFDPVLVTAVARSGSSVVVVDPRATGFPLGFVNDVDLVEDSSFVFVPDADGSLATIETFPPGMLLRVVVTGAGVQSPNGEVLQTDACVVTTVGPDTLPPQVLGWTRATGPFEITPGNGATNVGPYSTVRVRFNKPVDPWTVGESLARGSLTPPFRGVSVTAPAGTGSYPILLHAQPRTHADLCEYEVLPAQNLPCGTRVTVDVNAVTSIGGLPLGRQIQTSFATAAGPGLANAPVAPEAIYVGIGGAQSGVAVLDLNGFGQGTGNLASSRFPLNPNLGRPGVFPALAPGTSSLDAGSDGALTLTRDQAGSFRLLAPPLLASVGDMALGQPLDLVFNNEAVNSNATRSNHMNPATFRSVPGNTIMAAPHPNPPRLVFPPPNPGQAIDAEEPTVTSSMPPYIPGTVMTFAPPCMPSPLNRLIRGNPFSNTNPGIFDTSFEGVFNGPQAPPPTPAPPPAFCPFTVRQQVGQFLYVLDRANRRVLAVNSNRFTVLASIALPDPISMAMSPNLKLLAVSNFAGDSVSFIDVEPGSPTFHQVRGVVTVGRGPVGLAWQPAGEDLLVCNQTAGSVSIVSGVTLRVRKTVSAFVNAPVDVAVTLRQVDVGYDTRTYFAYVLNGDGTVAVFESGPSPAGADDVVARVTGAPFRFARAIQPDLTRFNAACWVTHQDASGLGQVSRIEQGFDAIGDPQWVVVARYGGLNSTTPVHDLFSGNALADIAFDEIRNNGGVPEVRSTLPGLTYAAHSGKGQLRRTIDGRLVPAHEPRFLFVAAADAGKVDVFELTTGTKIYSLDVPGVARLCHYWRQ